MAGAGFAALVLVLAIAVPLLLWILIDSETDRTYVMDREAAEQTARADSRQAAERHARRDKDESERF